MALRYTLESLSQADGERWDELTAAYPTRELFHRQAWLDYLQASRGVQIRKWAIRGSGSTQGYLCAGVVRKGPFRILASPLKGWGTNYMGPVAGPEFDAGMFLESLDDLARRERFSLVEVEGRVLARESIEGAGYRPVTSWTYEVPLSSEAEMWDRLQPDCRKSVRRAIKSGLRVEMTTDESAADEFYDRYLDLMRNKGLVPSYPRQCPRLLVTTLGRAGLLFALRIVGPDQEALAVGLFPHDDRTVYFWGGASWQQGREMRPNDLLHWSAMRIAAERGLTCYDMCGYGRFKKKFSGKLETVRRWHKSYLPGMEAARGGYALWFQLQSRIRGWWGRAVHQIRESWVRP